MIRRHFGEEAGRLLEQLVDSRIDSIELRIRYVDGTWTVVDTRKDALKRARVVVTAQSFDLAEAVKELLSVMWG